MESKCHNFSFWSPDFGKQHLHLKAPAVTNAINHMYLLTCIKVSARKLILNGSIFVQEIGKAFQKKSRMWFYVSDISPPGLPVRGNVCENVSSGSDILEVISSVVPLESQMKACSTRTWGDDSSKPLAIPALGVIKVIVKIYNILSNINTSANVFSKNFHFDLPELKSISQSRFFNMSLHNKHGQNINSLEYLCRHIHRLWISWSFGSKHRWHARLQRKDYFCCDSNYNWFGGLCPNCSHMAFYK